MAPTTTTTLKKVRRVAHVTPTTVARHSRVVASSTTQHVAFEPERLHEPDDHDATSDDRRNPHDGRPHDHDDDQEPAVTEGTGHCRSRTRRPTSHRARTSWLPVPCTFASGVWSCANPCVVGTATALSWPGYTNGVACTNYILAAINNARADRGRATRWSCPVNWFSLSVPQQLFVLVDLERTARGLPAVRRASTPRSAPTPNTPPRPTVIPRSPPASPMANDAQGSAGFGGAWSGGFTLLAADYIWMYDDTWGGSAAKTSNIACTSAGAAGCWAHRDELLGSDPGYNQGVGLGCTNCEVGTGFAMVNGDASYVDLIEIPKGSPPPMSFTWANNVLPNLP